MIRTTLLAALFAVACAGAASAQPRNANQMLPQGPTVITTRLPDLEPLPTRLGNNVISVRNGGAGASVASVVTVNCHKVGQQGGCAEIPAAYVAQYTNPAYPNRLVVNVPALNAGHVYNHTLPFFAGLVMPAGSYQYDFVADAGASNAESNEANNAGSWTKVVP